ncbi:MAG TPA: protein kinase, partial [Bryobacteraceae bacterium]
MEFQLGETYDGYEFLDVLKRSRNGIEFRVKNTRAGRLEALRALPQSAQDDLEQSERFVREMRVHARLQHPNIVTLFNAIELEKHLIMTTELVEGQTLADLLVLGARPWEEAVALIRQAISAVAYAHRQGIVHRDIRPENIILVPGGVLKLANFSLAKGASSPTLTHIGLVVGNLKYISPEQVKGTGDIDARSDLYSLGMVLYEMLCGRTAFNFESQFELMTAQVFHPPVPPSEVSAAVPAELDAVVLKALAKDPGARYQTAAEFDQALIEAAAGLGRARVAPELVVPSTPAVNGSASTTTANHPEVPPPSGCVREEPAATPVAVAACSSMVEIGVEEAAAAPVAGAAPEVVAAEPAVIDAAPEVAPAESAVVDAAPEVAPAEPAAIDAAPEVASAEPAVVDAAPEVAPAEPAAIDAAPE